MRNIRLIAKQEYLRSVRQRSFLVTTIGIPVLLAVVMGISILVGSSRADAGVLGYVDRAGLLDPSAAAFTAVEEDEEPVRVRAFDDLDAGQAALEEGAISVLFDVPTGYPTEAQVTVYYWEDAPDQDTWVAWNRFARAALLADVTPAVRDRLLAGTDVTILAMSGDRKLVESDVIGIILPIIAGILFMVTGMMSSGYLLQALVDEKANRTMEVVISSVRPSDLIAGKALGLISVSLTQLGVWILFLVVALVVGGPILGEFEITGIPWNLLGVVVVYFLPAFGLLSAMMIGIGGIVSDARQGGALSGPLTLPFMLPIMVSPLMFTNPDSPVLLVMTFFPLTSFLTVVMRAGYATVPFWQMAVSWLLLVVTTVGAMWLAAAVFRLGMLRYGQRLSLQQVVAGLRGQRVAPVQAGSMDA